MNPLNLHIQEVDVIYKTKVKPSERPFINGIEDAVNLFRQVFDIEKIELKEMFYAAYFNRANKLLGVIKISEGSATGTIADPKDIIRTALLLNAQSIIICHNHPSGNTKPSIADDNTTEKLKNACKIMDLKLNDHIILTSESFYSYADSTCILN